MAITAWPQISHLNRKISKKCIYMNKMKIHIRNVDAAVVAIYEVCFNTSANPWILSTLRKVHGFGNLSVASVLAKMDLRFLGRDNLLNRRQPLTKKRYRRFTCSYFIGKTLPKQSFQSSCLSED